MRRTVMFSAISLLIPSHLAAAGAAVPDVGPGLEALRSGRFEEARASFARLTATVPAAPEGPFFEAFHLWWRLLDHPEDRALRLAMEERLSEAERRARLLVDSQVPSDHERGQVFQGISLLLSAQSRAARGIPFSAASLVRQGHRALTGALEERPDGADALFAMGAYNYYADHLPLLAKGLRFFLFIPGGDSAKGIAQLEQAGETSSLFGTESLMLLAHIFSGEYEVDYGRALSYVEKAAARCAGSPLISLARADLLFKIGQLRESSELATESLAAVREKPGYAVELERALDYRAAACLLKLYDPLAALQHVESSLGRSIPESTSEKKRWIMLWVDSAREAGRLERLEFWIRRLELPENTADSLRRRAGAGARDGVAPSRAEALRTLASGRTLEAHRQLQGLLERNPADPRLRYDIGRLLQQEGRLEEARPHLQAVIEGAWTSSTADLAGWAMLRLGWQLEHEGRRAEALTLYRRAAEMKQFTFQPAALDRLAHPSAPQPEG